MNLIKLADKIIHSIPILPKKLQGTWPDKIWKRIENLMIEKAE